MAETDAGAAAAEAPKDKNRNYTIFTEVEIDFGDDAGSKAALEQIEALGAEGKATVLVRVGRALAPDPKKGLEMLANMRDLDGDYEVIAETARNKFEKVTTKQERVVKIG